MPVFNSRLPGLIALLLFAACNPRLASGLRKHDLHKDIEMTTTQGVIVLRLSDSTPLHRDNFLLLVKKGYYDSILFHRVIQRFMIQAGDPNSRHALQGTPLGDGGPAYTVPAEFRPTLFHKRGALAAAREGDDVNPQMASSASQFYIVQGKVFTSAGLDSVETFRLKGRKIPADQREVYQRVGGAPHLDQHYTVFGEVIRGMEVVDSIAAVRTSGRPYDRPLQDVRILKMRLISRK